LVALAVPIFDQNNNVIAGLAVHAPDARMDLATIRENIADLMDTANQLRGLLLLN